MEFEREFEIEFVYQFTWRGKLHELKVPLKLPSHESIEELSSRIVKAHSIPYHLEEELTSELRRVISRESSKHQDSCCDQIILTALQDEDVVSDRVQKMVERYTETYLDFTTLKGTEKDKFPELYHNLIQSPYRNTVLQVEQSYAVAIRDLLKAKDNALDILQKRHDGELSKAMSELGVYTSDYDINQLMRRHVEERESLEHKWLKEVHDLQETQKKGYRGMLTDLHEDMTRDSKKLSSQMSSLEIGEDTSEPLMEESFTIHLGAQEKSSHNLRLLCGDLLSFCQHADGGSTDESNLKLNPQRIQIAMSLYTTNIFAIILIVDQEINTVMGSKEVFANACRQSTDFHFPSIDEQLDVIREHAATLCEERLQGLHNENPHNLSSSMDSRQHSISATPDRSREPSLERDANIPRSLSMPDSSSSPNGESGGLLHPNWPQRDAGTRSPSPTGGITEEEGVKLKPGDIYLTRHSNLSQVHVVCHLVAEERSILDPALRARDNIMQGLRNSLRTMAKHGIRHITLPLLLTGQMKPDMTISWCLRRAELVFKSVKGFLLESTAWSGSSESWNIQFLIPKNTSVDLFEQISDLLSKTFRKSVTLTLK